MRDLASSFVTMKGRRCYRPQHFRASSRRQKNLTPQTSIVFRSTGRTFPSSARPVCKESPLFHRRAGVPTCRGSGQDDNQRSIIRFAIGVAVHLHTRPCR